jgi:DNA-binding CsgD family transcriptional regulator
MLAALGVSAQAELAASGQVPAGEAAAAGRALLATAEHTAATGLPRAGTLGPEGTAWLCRARAELTRIIGPPDPSVWSSLVSAFAYETCAPDGKSAAEGCHGYRQAYALLRRAEATLATKAPHGEVEPDLRAALHTAERLAARPLATAVRELAARAGVRLDAHPARPVPVGPDPLTPRERAVLALVAAGRTNRQAGAELFISEKTVSVHLSRVMAKLGASSRTEAVSVAYARGLLAPTDREMARVDP